MFTVGVVAGGPEGSLVIAKMPSLMQASSASKTPGSNSVPELNLAFHLWGSLAQPDYTGLRTGAFSKTTKRLAIQAAIEQELVECDQTLTLIEYLHSVVDEAIGMADACFNRHNINYHAGSDRKVIDQWLAKEYASLGLLDLREAPYSAYGLFPSRLA